MRTVVKFGGTSVGSGERIKRAAESVAEERRKGNEIVVVVSAMGDTTDHLIDEMEAVGVDESEGEDANEVVSMGERTSVRLFKAALENLGVDASFVEPGDANWPIITDEAGELNEDSTSAKVADLAESLEDEVVVVCGFLGETPDGRLTTLGRGGSDTTAMILGRYLDADEVVIVTDVDGVMTGDPSSVEGTSTIDEITVNEMQDLSLRGAQVVAPSALRYKRDGTGVRIVHHKHGDLNATGTEIVGSSDSMHEVDLRDSPVAAVTVAGSNILETPNLLARLSTALGDEDINIFGVSTGSDSMSFFVDENVADEAESILHGEVTDGDSLSSVTLREEIAMVVITGGEFIETPGVIYDAIRPLRKNDINIIELLSSATSIVIFIDWDEGKRVRDLVESVYE
ncbi:aspartate kinase [Halorutilales archaeon Cl-col2-1]